MNRHLRANTPYFFLFLLLSLLPNRVFAGMSLVEQARLHKAQRVFVAQAAENAKAGQHSEALDNYERALRMRSSPSLLLAIAAVYEQKGDTQSSAEVYEAFVSLAAPDDPQHALAEGKASKLDANKPLGRFPLLVGASRMVKVEASEFTMGFAGYDETEKPAHTVRLSAYSIDAFEVSNAQYARCVDAGICAESAYSEDPLLGLPRMPVVGVRWEDADKYCRFVGKHLPTEAEWERAARGTDGRVFPWGNDSDCSKANFGALEESDFGCQGKNPGRLMPSGSYPDGRSPVGAYDMAGNVQEWVADWFLEDYYETSPEQDPAGPSSGEYRVVRGGSFGSLSNFVETTDRKISIPESYGAALGFRCVKRATSSPTTQP